MANLYPAIHTGIGAKKSPQSCEVVCLGQVRSEPWRSLVSHGELAMFPDDLDRAVREHSTVIHGPVPLTVPLPSSKNAQECTLTERGSTTRQESSCQTATRMYLYVPDLVAAADKKQPALRGT